MWDNWFQTEECYNFLKSMSFLEAFKFEVCRDGEVKGRIVGYIQKDGGRLKQFFSRRAIVNGGPFLMDDITNEELSQLLTKTTGGLIGKCIYIEIRNYQDYSKFKDVFKNAGFAYEQHLDFIVNTDNKGRDEVLQILDKSRRRKINKALKLGVEIITNPSICEIHEFYSVLSILYKTKVKTPLFPFEFFEKLHSQDFGQVNIIKYNNEVIAGQVCICEKGKAVYELYMAGKDTVYKDCSPSAVATFSGILFAAENQYKCCDMMGAGKPNEHYGVRDFKASFGGELVEYGRFKCILSPLLYCIGAIGVKMIRKF